jgi:hypothetical protein
MFGIFTPLEWALAAARAILWFSIVNARADCGFSSRQRPHSGAARADWATGRGADSRTWPGRFCLICPANAAKQRAAGAAMLHFRTDRLYSKAGLGADSRSPKHLERQEKVPKSRI